MDDENERLLPRNGNYGSLINDSLSTNLTTSSYNSRGVNALTWNGITVTATKRDGFWTKNKTTTKTVLDDGKADIFFLLFWGNLN